MNFDIQYFEVFDDPRSREPGTGLVGVLARDQAGRALEVCNLKMWNFKHLPLFLKFIVILNGILKL